MLVHACEKQYMAARQQEHSGRHSRADNLVQTHWTAGVHWNDTRVGGTSAGGHFWWAVARRGDGAAATARLRSDSVPGEAADKIRERVRDVWSTGQVSEASNSFFIVCFILSDPAAGDMLFGYASCIGSNGTGLFFVDICR